MHYVCSEAILDAQQHEVGAWLWAYEATVLQSLTGYAYLVEAINALHL